MKWLAVPLLFCLLGVLARGQETATIDEIRGMVTSSNYRGALDKINKLLFPSLKDEPMRYELMMLKGECQLQLKDRIGAATAFKSAAKAARDVNELAAARANQLIVERSTSGQFKPRFGSGAEPIEILLIDPRKQAMRALRQEMWSQYEKQIESALRADKLSPIEQVFPRVADMYLLEMYTDAQAGEMDRAMRDLGGHTFKLVRTEVTTTANRIDYLSQMANSSSGNAAGWETGRMGLTSQQRDEVKRTIEYLSNIRDRVVEYRQAAAKLGGDAGKWDALVADTVVLISDAESLYNDR
jgi:hypothetical protein